MLSATDLGAIEALFDIGQHLLLVAEVRATSQGDIPQLLKERNIIDEKVYESLKGMYGFRNRLVHGYETLDDNKVSEVLRDNLEDIETVVTIAEKEVNA